MSARLCLIKTSETPPGGWRYTEPSTGFHVDTYDWDTFLRKILEHRLGNNIPLDPDWKEKLKSQICEENLPLWKDFCKLCDTNIGVTPFSLEAARSFLKFIGVWLAAGGGYVDQAEADRRAKICAGCQYNVRAVPKCGSCWNAVIDTVMKLTGKRSTSYDESIQNCGVCSCQLRVAVWMPLEVQQKALSEDTKAKFRELKDYCWKADNV